MTALDLDFVRSQFPAFGLPEYNGQSFFENAGGSFACAQTIEALHRYYTRTKVQPYASYATSATAGEQMDASRSRWAQALGVATDEVQFGPSTSMNTYVLAQAFGRILAPGDEVIVTNQDHEANTGAMRRMAEATGATLREWRVDPATGLLDGADLRALLGPRTKLLCFPHCSNIVGQENPAAEWVAAAQEVGARVVVDGVSFAPHGLPDVGALGADIYLFSLYKVYSVHQGLMVTANGILDHLPNQGHFFNAGSAAKRLTPAGPDHAQEAAAGAVLDYVEASAAHHGVGDGTLRSAAAEVSTLWQDHEHTLVEPVLDYLADHDGVRLVGPVRTVDPGLHRCPTVAFVPRAITAADCAQLLVQRGVMCSNGDFYAKRLLEGVDVDLTHGVVRVSWVHYTGRDDIDRLLGALDEVLSP
ncbi:MAG: aminotransferase class V-fold PLP-dependent enzyme [Actinomycetota bacterium]